MENRPTARVEREEQCAFCFPDWSPCRYADRDVIAGRPWPFDAQGNYTGGGEPDQGHRHRPTREKR